MTYIVFERADKSVAISTLVGEPDIEEVVRKFQNAHPDEFPKYSVHETLKVPDSRLYRHAWIRKGNKIVVDKDRCV